MKEQSKKKTEQKEQKSIGKEILEWIWIFVVVSAISFFIVTFVGVRTKVEGQSMMPTLENGDNLIVDKMTYRFRDPERYEIIVFPYQHEENVYYIKRIIGLPGETIQIIDGYVYIDGEKLEKDYGAEVMQDAGIAEQPIELGKDEYFVLGDNRNHSSDSRASNVGVLNREDLIGRAWVRIWPLDHLGVVAHGEKN